MKRFSYSDRHKLFVGKTIISHNTSWGGAFADHKHWMAERDGEVWDYGSLKFLINDAIRDGFDYVVLRVHRNGDATQQCVQPTRGRRREKRTSGFAPCG